MVLQKTNLNYISILIISVYAFGINWFSANTGVMPIDTFAFFDTGFNITLDKLPIRDFWVFTGIVVDFLQALFFITFGNNWTSYVLHGCLLNILGSISFYLFLNKLNLKKEYSLLYSISFATLCYPVSGTPFAYIHSYIFSLLSIFLLCIAIKEKKDLLWFVLPFTCFLAFFSMQTPSVYIILIVLIFSTYFLLIKKNLSCLKNFVLGGTLSFSVIFLYLLFTRTPFENFLYQYFLFPLTIGEGRIASNANAYVALADQMNFQRLIGNFKFIHIFLFPLIFFTLKNFLLKKKDNLNLINFIVILSTFSFLFNQLVTANQIYIFSLIPIMAALLHLNIIRFKIKFFPIFLIFLILVFATIKFHYRYNVDRKFDDIENLDKSKSISAEIIDEKMKFLKWLTPYQEPQEEIDLIKLAIKTIKEDKREKVLLTHYHFISTVLEEDLNIFNRWYLWDNNTHPTETNKYFNFYKKMINKNIEENNIKVIYLLTETKKGITFKNIKNYFTEKCFESTNLVQDRFSYHEIVNCKN